MSTRSTLAYGPGFHLFHDLMEEDEAVHLTLEGEGLTYSSSPSKVTVRIPIEVWEHIRHRGAASLDLVEVSDEELQKKVEADVSHRIQEYNNEENRNAKALLAFFGSLVYDGANQPKEVQVAAGLQYWTKERERQRGVAAKLSSLVGLTERDETP